MTELLLAVDDETEHVEQQVDTILDLPMTIDELSVTVLHVFSDNPSGASITQLRTARLAEERLEDAEIDVRLVERSGEPSPEILEYAAEADVDLLCLAGRKRSPTGKALFGSVTQDVVLSTERPVLIAGKTNEGAGAT